MKQTKILMGMPITVEVVHDFAVPEIFEKVFSYFEHIDQTFSTYKNESEISKINRGELALENASTEMREVFSLSEQTKKLTAGFFDIKTPSGKYDPSGLVKGWAIFNAGKILEDAGLNNFFVEAGGDIQAKRRRAEKSPWKVGIRNPFNIEEIVKVLDIWDEGVATSGTYIRGQHIYNPFEPDKNIHEISSLTVVARDIYEADRFATAAFAMGKKGIDFVENLKGFEGYMIDQKGLATFTSGFNKYMGK